MIQFTSQLQEQLDEELLSVERHSESKLQYAEGSIKIIQKRLQELRDYILDYEFEDSDEEILFFKKLLPKMYSKLIYHLRLFHLESRRPTGCKELQYELLKSELKIIRHFFDHNLDFYQYYNSGTTYLDHLYFKRHKYDQHLIMDEYFMLVDPNFSTVHSYKVAKMLAYEHLQAYISQALLQLDQKQEIDASTDLKQHAIKWTASKTDLIELAYAVFSVGGLNNGNVGLNKIISFLESIFDTDLGNPSRVLQQMRIRKKNRTCFLDKLRESLLRHMDDLDDREEARA